MKKTISFLMLLALLAVQCQDKAPAFEEKLQTLDKEMGGAAATNKAKAQEFIKVSEEWATTLEKTNPDKYVDVLLKAAGLAKSVEMPDKAIELYKKIADGLPNHKKAPTAMFMIGFVQENDLKNLDQAKATYEAFLQKYPNDPDFTDDAQNALKLLGKSPEEIIKEFEQNNPEGK